MSEDVPVAWCMHYRRLACVLAGWLSLSAAVAADYQVEVVAPGGDGLAGAVVYLEPETPLPDAPPATAIMDQVDRQFEPHILVVQRGSEVSFPNSDSIKHHVYSFSDAKKFQIRLYRGESTAPVLFDNAGEVELGCNVHDWMLGYIFVVDTPYFARADAEGRALISAPPGNYRLGVWHPRIRDDVETLALEVADDATPYRVVLKETLRDPFEPVDPDEFGDYD